MQLKIRQSDHAFVDEQGKRVPFNQYHPLDKRHDYLVRKVDEHTFDVKIVRGKKVVQQGRIQTLSFVTERLAAGTRSHIVTLDPRKPIWPIGDLVKKLSEHNVPFYMITPLVDDVLTECFFPDSKTPTHIITDGVVEFTELPGDSNVPALCAYSVSKATWVVERLGDAEAGSLLHIYLWMEAAQKADEILAVIQRRATSAPSVPGTM